MSGPDTDLMRRIAAAGALISVVVGLTGLAGWAAKIQALQTVLPRRPQLEPDDALGCVLLGVAVWLLLPQVGAAQGIMRFRASQLLGLVSVLLAVGTLLGHTVGVDIGAHLNGSTPKPPALPSTLSAAALGLAVMLLQVRIRGIWLAEVFAVVTIQMAVLGLLGHMFGVSELYGGLQFRKDTGMAVHAGLAYLGLGIGLMCARADRGIMAVLRSQTPGGTMMRRWVFMPCIMLIAMGILYLALSRGGVVDDAIRSWALFMTSMIVLTVAVWATASVLHRAGLERNEAQRTLEQRVKQRTADLHRANAALEAAREELARSNSDLENTVQERTRHLRETISSLETVCYNIAHDLRAPNRAIAGFAQVLLSEHSEQLDETARDCLTRIRTAAQRSDALTLDLLAYGRLGHTDLPCSRQCLKTHLDNVMANLAGEIQGAKAHVEVSEPLPWVWANAVALDQVLTNLVTNALKFVEEGVQPRVRIRAREEGAYSRILVEDNGIGIPPEYRKNIFGVFQRLHPIDKYPGSGIGLAIVQKGVERMGGKVGVESTDGHGSCFWFELRTA